MSGALDVATFVLKDAGLLATAAPEGSGIGVSGAGALCQSPEADHSGAHWPDDDWPVGDWAVGDWVDDHWAGAAVHCGEFEDGAPGLGVPEAEDSPGT